MTFSDFNFNEQVMEGVTSMGFETPTPIQAEAIPIILKGQDIIACAQTGTGKTGAYLLPILEDISKSNKHQISTLILAPTRELAQQIDQQVEGFAYFSGVTSIAVFGGGDGIAYEQQRRGIQNNVNIIIATPGRLIAHLNSGVLNFHHLKHLILDEADRMLDMGFYDDIMKIVSYLPKKRQTLMFSATMPGRIRSLAKSILNNPAQVNIAISQPAVGIDQQVYRVYDAQKTPLLVNILKNGDYKSIIIFASRKEIVRSLNRELRSAKMNSNAFHSDLEQREREEILLQFKNKELPIIVGTDALSRGIDVEGIDLVINYDVPGDPEDYVHRIGRTARAETTGTAITFVNHKDERRLKAIEKLIEKPIRLMELPDDLKAIAGPKPEQQGEKKPNTNRKRRWGNKKPNKGKPQA